MKEDILLESPEVEFLETLNVVPLRNIMMVPKIVAPILIGRKVTIDAVEDALAKHKRIVCLTQKNDNNHTSYPEGKNLYRVGTYCSILQVFRLPDGNLRILVEGLKCVLVDRLSKNKDGFFKARVHEMVYEKTNDLELQAEVRAIKKLFAEYISIDGNIPQEVLKPLDEISKPSEFFYYVLANISSSVDKKIDLLKIGNINQALSQLLRLLHKELEILKLEKKIDVNVNNKLNKLQREYYLREQLKEIEKELGLDKESSAEVDDLEKDLLKLPLNEDIRKIADSELQKLKRIPTGSQEYTVIYNYLDWMRCLPWSADEVKDFDLVQAQKDLDANHYGLDKVKDVVLEYVAVLKFVQENRGKILCFVGAPGVGKTSLGKAIAKSLGKKFARLSLGGVRDEAEIRGHRRTYVGAVPGVIINSIKKAGTLNPVIMMDEIDKLSSDFRGDPASALLEVLDPEQNNSFRDHYLDFDYDLSKVTFITTANTLSSIPSPLLDRMEIVRLPGYTMFEKVNIAERHLIRRQIDAFKTKGKVELEFSDEIIRYIVKNYTQEVGVRQLEKQIEKIYRKVIREIIQSKKVKIKLKLNKKLVEKYLGVSKVIPTKVEKKAVVGVVNGLAWTMVGGEMLKIEISKFPGTGKIKLTGNLGDIMKESAQAAYTFARVNAKKYKLDKDFHKNTDLHLHIPEGAVPKDGPSAGVTMATAIISVLSDRKVKANIAMTGEISLKGEVMAIGGLAEKLVAAGQAEIKKVLIPKDNLPILQEIPDEIKHGLEIVPMETIDQVLGEALV